MLKETAGGFNLLSENKLKRAQTVDIESESIFVV